MEKRIKELCLENSEMQEKYYLFCHIKKEFIERLRTVPAYFPHFSIHDGSHSANIIKYLSMLLGEENVNKMSVSDLLLLCTAAYAHDISMSVSYEMIHEKMLSDDWNDKLKEYTQSEQEDLATVAERLLRFPEIEPNMIALDVYSDVLCIIEESFRKEHALRSSKELLNNCDLEKLFGIRIRTILSEVCRLHGCSISEIMNLPYQENGLFDDYIHPRFVAALLALGDLLDMDTDRFDKNFLTVATPMLKLSEIHKKKHESITHYLVKNGIIEITSNCETIEVYRAMRDWLEWIKQVTEYMSIHWSKIAPEGVVGTPYLNEYKILLRNDTKWIEFADLKFDISTKHSLKLLSGTSLYRNKFTFVRELIQNAVDATMKRLYLMFWEQGHESSDSELLKWLINNQKVVQEFEIKVTLSIENGEAKFVIEDQGTGISSFDLKRIANVSGKSDKEKEFIQNMPEFFRPSGAFGIGLQSVFAVANSFSIITRTEDEETKLITFQDAQDGRGYINVSDCDRRKSVGTTVIVSLDNNRFLQEDLHINDFAFKVYPREKHIYQSMIAAMCNTDLGRASRKLQKTEYIPVTAEKKTEDFTDYGTNIILQYNSLFADELFQKDDYLDIQCEESHIRYRHYDVKNGCIFNAFLCSGYDEEKTLSTYEPVRRRMEYNNSVFYRNSCIENDYGDTWHLGEDRFKVCLDYSINILSGNSEDILTFERRAIKDSYKRQLNTLINEEICLFLQHMVEYLLKDNVKINSSLLLILYQAAREYDYKHMELREKYRETLKDLLIGGYRENNHEEVKYSAYDLSSRELYFIKRYDKDDDMKWALNLTDPDFAKLIGQETKFLDFNAEEGYHHPLNHRIKRRFIYNLDGILHEVYIVEPYMKQDDFVYKRDTFFKHEQFLHVLFGNRRCISAWPEYERLQTTINSGVGFGPERLQKQIEMQIDPLIKQQLMDELLDIGCISDCCQRYLTQIATSETYKNNLKYIKNELAAGDQSIDEQYKSLWREELLLLENSLFQEFNKNIGKALLEKVNSGIPDWDIEPFGHYITE